MNKNKSEELKVEEKIICSKKGLKNKMNVKDIIKEGESKSIEFKETFNKETIETAVAFANTKGGIIF